MECDICSKGAAYVSHLEQSSSTRDSNSGYSAKRYERMMKAHGIYQTNSTIADTPIPSTKPKTSSSATATNPASSKKRKQTQFVETNTNTDDDEGLNKVKPEPPNKKIKPEAVKEESTDNQASPQALTSAKEKTPSKYTMGLDDADDSAMFRDFLSFGAFGGQDVGSKDMFGATAGLDVKPVKGVVPESMVINE